MSKILFTLMTLLCSFTIANAQFSKGNILLAGTISYSSSSSTSSGTGAGTDQSNHNGYFSLSIGKAINENSVAGINFGYGHGSSSISPSQGGTKSDAYSIGVFYRKYKAMGKDFFLFGEGRAGYSGSTGSATDNSGNQYASSHINTGFIEFYPGIDYRVSNKFLLEISIPSFFYVTYSASSNSDQNGQTSKGSSFGISTSLASNPIYALGVGFVLVL
jgi:hypothetical protein